MLTCIGNYIYMIIKHQVNVKSYTQHTSWGFREGESSTHYNNTISNYKEKSSHCPIRTHKLTKSVKQSSVAKCDHSDSLKCIPFNWMHIQIYRNHWTPSHNNICTHRDTKVCRPHVRDMYVFHFGQNKSMVTRKKERERERETHTHNFWWGHVQGIHAHTHMIRTCSPKYCLPNQVKYDPRDMSPSLPIQVKPIAQNID